MVSWQQRFVGLAGRSGNRKLPRWPAPRPSQREPRRRIRGVVPARPFRDSANRPPQRKPRQACSAGRLTAPTRSSFLQPAEAALSQLPFLNRQALHLRPDPTRVYRSAFQAGNGAARPQSDGQDPRQPYRRAGSRARPRDRGQSIGRRAGELPRPSPQPAADLRGTRRGDGRGAGRLMPRSRRCSVNSSAPIFSTNIRSRRRRCSIRVSWRIPISPERRKAAFASSSVFVPSAKAMCLP